MTREAFIHSGEDENGGAGGGGGGGEGGTKRDYFTPLWETKGAQTFWGGTLLPVPGARTAGGVPGSNLVESEGFVPLRKVRLSVVCGRGRGAGLGNKLWWGWSSLFLFCVPVRVLFLCVSCP